MVTANKFQQNNLIQVDLDLVQHSGRTAALAFAVGRHPDPLLGSADGTLLADVVTALSLSESTTRKMLAKLEAIGLVWSEQPDPNGPTEFFTEYNSFTEWVEEQEDGLDAWMCDLANEVLQANSDREVLS
jgi:predicted transcriptional regulator